MLISTFTIVWKNWFILVISDRNLDCISNVTWCRRFCRKNNEFVPNCLDVSKILNRHIFYWRLVLAILLSIRPVMTCTLFHFNVSYWLDMDSKTCWTVVIYFLQILRVQKLVLFPAENKWFDGLLFVDWEIYDMLWCSLECLLEKNWHWLHIYHPLWRDDPRGQFLML